MNVNVQSHHVVLPSHAGRELARRAHSVLHRFGDGIANLDLTLKDVNGPRGGRDKVCQVRAELVDGRQVIVIDRSDSLREAIGRSLRRAKVLIAGELVRGRRRARKLLRRRKHHQEPESTLTA